MEITLVLALGCFAAAAMIAALSWGDPFTLALVNGAFNVAGVVLTAYVISITTRLDRRVRNGGE